MACRFCGSIGDVVKTFQLFIYHDVFLVAKYRDANAPDLRLNVLFRVNGCCARHRSIDQLISTWPPQALLIVLTVFGPKQISIFPFCCQSSDGSGEE